ncbi:MAG: F0F1 ATP synthase subunit B [Lachnospiraceae bacterium]|nr:F0F1 ATP synthase subunit B [Lachnospiraceae bacterium]
MSRLFDLDLQLIVDSGLTIIALFFLYFALSYFLFNPARKMLQNRQEKIKGELESAAADMETAGNLKEEYELKIKEIDKEAERILGEARKKALANESQIIEEARAEAARIMDKARKDAELEKQKAADEVKKEMIALASMMAGKVVSASIDTTVQESLIDETLKEMGESTWLS